MNRFFLCDEIGGRQSIQMAPAEIRVAMSHLHLSPRLRLHMGLRSDGRSYRYLRDRFKRNQPMIGRLARW